MTDNEVADLLKSDQPLVMIEAPAGCGKTYQAAEFAAHAAESIGNKRILTLTHTHAACAVIAERTKNLKHLVDIRTLDSLIHEIASAYRFALGLPEDVAVWVRSGGGSHEQLAEAVSVFVSGNPMVAKVLAQRFPKIICDEHQDSSSSQERLILAIGKAGSSLRIFGDPMQVIPGGQGQAAQVAELQHRWEALKKIAAFGELKTPHRWNGTNPALGAWILDARAKLRDGHPLNLGADIAGRPDILVAENTSMQAQSYRFSPQHNNFTPINTVINQDTSMLCIAGRSATVDGLRSTFKGQLPIWEGHTRTELDSLIIKLTQGELTVVQKSNSLVQFLKSVLTGFDSKFYSRFLSEIETPTANPRGRIPPEMAAMAQLVLDDPSHAGFARAAAHLRSLIYAGANPFSSIRIDRPRELNDFIRTAGFDDVDEGLAEIKQRRSRAHPMPPKKCLSTVHKSKGLEAHTTVVFGCDAVHFPDQPAKRNLLYVALSRATHRLVIVRSEANPSPILVL